MEAYILRALILPNESMTPSDVDQRLNLIISNLMGGREYKVAATIYQRTAFNSLCCENSWVFFDIIIAVLFIERPFKDL